ncbi:MarR family winged helix-turn-helix transcriptional regulator [Terrilactibacillus laevilacticus]|uniref:MarR family winged helix-turn-helix transcriptional regulator n=1 Tax=Terrilactibacillus laevilacticus TaxID=1380157 RepID=A0ABW5PPJ2_9BACI|nr:MarR family winged helix-turn-helix transcriptional regulator [Terrilactibacillus laevilacticus]
MNHEEDELNELLILFYFGYRTFTEKPNQMIQKYGIQRVHHRILFFIARIPGITVNELLTVLEVTKQALNHPLRQLTEKGFILHKPGEFDKRYKQLYLTDRGVNLERELSKVQQEQMKTIFTKLGGNHQEAWVDVMKELSSVRPGQKFFKDLFLTKNSETNINNK